MSTNLAYLLNQSIFVSRQSVKEQCRILHTTSKLKFRNIIHTTELRSVLRWQGGNSSPHLQGAKGREQSDSINNQMEGEPAKMSLKLISK